jgi:hypothetical protein
MRDERSNTLKPWVKVLLVTVIIAAPAMVLVPVIWSPAEGSPEPTGGRLPFFVFLALMESVLFGLGISFLLFGLRRLEGEGYVPEHRLAHGLLVAHDNLHISNGNNL